MAVVGGFVIHQQRQIKNTAKEAASAAHAIQRNRLDTISRNCTDQNLRHDAAITALYSLLQKSGVPPARQDKAAQPIIQLIDALAPSQDCRKLVTAASPQTVK